MLGICLQAAFSWPTAVRIGRDISFAAHVLINALVSHFCLPLSVQLRCLYASENFPDPARCFRHHGPDFESTGPYGFVPLEFQWLGALSDRILNGPSL